MWPKMIMTPIGVESIYNACNLFYKDQPNPLQVTPILKYWLGGPDALDYISMYENAGNIENCVPPHWHYVSYGLSDLYGDGRVHPVSNKNGISGFGFELTFRLKKDVNAIAPPTWPAVLMQQLARYVFQSDSMLHVGDNVPWYRALDKSDSRIQHVILTEDIQLKPIKTPHGNVNFIQIVGVCEEELRSAQLWNGFAILRHLRTNPITGGTWLITDMRRGESIFDLDPATKDAIEIGITTEGSSLSGVSSECFWQQLYNLDTGDNSFEDTSSHKADENNADFLNRSSRNGLFHNDLRSTPIDLKSLDYIDFDFSEILYCSSEKMCKSERKMSCDYDPSFYSKFPEIKRINSVHLKFKLEAGCLLPLVLKSRLKHGKHFTFKCAMSESAITLISSSVVGAFVNENTPYAAHGPWLQVLITEDLIDEMYEDLIHLTSIQEVKLPTSYHWPERGLCITICDEVS